MRGPTGGAAHLARATALAVAVGGLGAGAHVAAGGAVPPGGVLAVLLLLTLWACAWATRFRLSPAAVLALLGAGQLALHQAFGMLAAGGCAPVAGHDHAGSLVAHGCAEAVVTAEPAGLTRAGVLMLLAHVLATLATAALVGAGERAVWGLWSWLTRRVPPAAPVAGPVAARPHRASGRRDARPPRRVLLRMSPRRGPPAAALFA